MQLPGASSVPDLRSLALTNSDDSPTLRRVQSEVNHARNAPPPLLRIRTERLAIDDDSNACSSSTLDAYAPGPPSPLRTAFSRLAPLSLHAEIHDWPGDNWPSAPETPQHRELSIVFETRGRDHRSRVTVTADVRLVRALAWFALLTVAAAMSAAAVKHARVTIAPSAFGFQSSVSRQRPLLAPSAAPDALSPALVGAASAFARGCSRGSSLLAECEASMGGAAADSRLDAVAAAASVASSARASAGASLRGNGGAGASAVGTGGARATLAIPAAARALASFHRHRSAVCRTAHTSLLVLQRLHELIVRTMAGRTAARSRAAFASTASARRSAAAPPPLRAHYAPAPAVALAAPAARPSLDLNVDAPAAAPTPVAWASGRRRAQRLALSRHARRLAFKLEPLARELGCAALLTALSEVSCAVLLPDSYMAVQEWHSANLAVSAHAIRAAQAQLGAALAELLPARSFSVAARSKSRLSVFDKAVLRGKAVGDLLAARIIIADADDDEQDARNCDRVRDLVAALWPEERARFKDYVRQPKANGYQSVHMTVRLPCGRPLEVQIRTRAMHAAAERGSACWGAYKSEACSVGGGAARRNAEDDNLGSATKRGSSWARALEGVRCLHAQQPERLRATLACAIGALPHHGSRPQPAAA